MFEEFTLDTPPLRLAARRLGNPHGPKLLALHGWLDNVASFTPIAPHFADHDLVVIDLPGHGRSTHRPVGAWYHFIDFCTDVLAAVEALGWARFSLLGHSLGGAIASVLSAALADRVERLYLIESLGPISTSEDKLPGLLAQALRDRIAIVGKQLRRFPDIDTAIAARRSNREMPLSATSARLLVERGLREAEGGYEWSSDPRLTLTSAMRLSESQVCGYLAGIRCPVRLVVADPPMPFVDVEHMLARTRIVPDLRLVRLAGTHHLHMETPAQVAAALRGD
ncbi:MAG TPA: alpha/beta hydrolase [Patescibacteria group bacterium]|nr:alpha/beta hydrolase [Patescibacteria group bacterium]